VEGETYDSSSLDLVPEANASETQPGSRTNAQAQPVLSALREANGNSSKSPRKVAFSTAQAVDENVSEVDLLPVTNPSSSNHPPNSSYTSHLSKTTCAKEKKTATKPQDSPPKRSKSKVLFTPSVIAATPHADDPDYDSQRADGKPNRARSPISPHSPSKPNAA